CSQRQEPETEQSCFWFHPGRLFGQDFQQLKEFCVSRRLKFIDDMFPPDRKSIGQGVLSPSDLARVVWLRPANPSFVLRGFSRFDFGQGVLVLEIWEVGGRCD
uniref:Calpain catalytic domain-containing protein n=1 Tax=Poecilia latipinna TaxID=48699 RepID=A0A3B3VA39_9TELE